MALHDLKARIIQVLRLLAPDSEPIIAIETKAQYSQLFPLTEDGDIVYKAYLNNLRLDIYFTDNSQAGIVCDKDLGTITLADIATDFPTISANGIIRCSCDLLISGTWYANDVLPEVTKDGSGNLLTALFTLGNTGITTIRGRIF